MLTVAGIVSAVSLVIVLAVTTVLIRQRYTLESDYTFKFDNLTKQINDVNQANVEYERRKQDTILNVQKDVDDILFHYATKDDILRNIQTKDALIKDLSVVNGINILAPSPSPFIESRNSVADRYGIGKYGQSTKVYSSSHPNATIGIGFADSNGGVNDIMTTKKEGVFVNGTVFLNDEVALTGSNNILHVSKRNGDGKGKVYVDSIESQGDTKLHHAVIDQLMISNINANTPSTYFNTSNNVNIIGGSITNIYSDVKTHGMTDINKGIIFNGSSQSVIRGSANGDIENIFTTTSNSPVLSERWINNGEVMHNLSSDGSVSHRSLYIGDSNNAVIVESGKDFNGRSTNLSSISFNGLTKNNTDVLLHPTASRWRAVADASASNDAFYIDQKMRNGRRVQYMTLKDEFVGIGTDAPNSRLHVMGGSIKQQTVRDGPSWRIGSDGNEGVIAYDGASFNFGLKGTKMMSVTADDISLRGNLYVNSNINTKNNISTKTLWLDGEIGIEKSSTGKLSVKNKNGTIGDMEANIINASGSVFGTNGIRSIGDIFTNSNIMVEKNATVKGDITINGTANFNGGIKFNSGGVNVDKDGNIDIVPKSGKRIIIGNDLTSEIQLGTGDNTNISVGKNNVLLSSLDGNTYINATRNGKIVYVGNSVNNGGTIIGENTANKIGTSLLPASDGNVFIRTSGANKSISIGDVGNVQNINIGNTGSRVNVKDRLCIDDVCMTKEDIQNFKRINEVISKPALNLTLNEIDNVRQILPRLRPLADADIERVRNMPAQPYSSLTMADLNNIRKLPTIIK